MKIRKLSMVSAILMVVLPFAAGASDWTPIIRNYIKADYRAGAQNWMITRDEKGWVYVANNNGILEFDGHSWDLSSMGPVRSVYRSSDSILYYGGYNTFGWLSSSGTQESLVSLLPDDVGNFSDIWRIHEIDKVIYFVSYNHIFKLVDGALSIIRSDARILFSAVINETLYLYVEGRGLCLLAGCSLVSVGGTERLAKSYVKGIFPYKGSMVIVTAAGGIYTYDGTLLRHVYTAADALMAASQVYCADLSGDHLFVGTIMEGLFIIDLNTLKVRRINLSTGLQNNTVHCVYATPEGNLWLGLGNGVSYVNFNSPLTGLYSASSNYGMGYTSIVHDGRLYLGTNQGLYVTDWPVESTADLNMIPVKGAEGQIWALNEIDGTLLCGANKGAMVIYGSDTQMLADFDGFWNFQIVPSDDDIMLAGTYNGLVVFVRKGEIWKFGWKVEGFDKSCVHVLYDNGSGKWYVDYGYGVCSISLDPSLKTVKTVEDFKGRCGKPHLSSDLEVVLTDIDKRYIGTEMYSNVWYVSSGKLYRDYISQGKERTDSLIAILTKDCLIEYYEHVFMPDCNTAVISTSDGFFKYNLHDEPYSRIEDSFEMRIRNVSVSTSDTLMNVCLDDALFSVRCDNEAVYRFEINTDVSPYALKDYTWQLYPVNSNPKPLDPSGVKEFQGLKEGEYVFTVTCNDHITGHSSSESFAFTVRPPWYRSILARIVYVVFVLAFFVCVCFGIKAYYYRQTRKRLYAQRMEDRKMILALQNEKLEESVRLKSNEISTSMLNIIQKQELLSSILNESKKISVLLEDSKTDEAQKLLGRLSNQLRHNIKDDGNWKKLEDNFNVVHHDFISRLKEAYPALNYTDVRLAVYIRMNLLTKEIAPLLNISERGLESARYRLRKKLNLKSSERLSDFLFKF